MPIDLPDRKDYDPLKDTLNPDVFSGDFRGPDVLTALASGSGIGIPLSDDIIITPYDAYEFDGTIPESHGPGIHLASIDYDVTFPMALFDSDKGFVAQGLALTSYLVTTFSVGSYNNQTIWTPTGAYNSHHGINPTGAVTLTGIANGDIGRFKIFTNVNAANSVTFSHESGSSTAANRFYCPGLANFVLSPGQSCCLYYSITDSAATVFRWIVIGSNPAGAITTHEAAGDPHTGYRLESADHTHATTGLQGGTVDHNDLTGFDQADTPTHIQIDNFDDGELFYVFEGELVAIGGGSTFDVLTRSAEGLPEWDRPQAVILGAYKSTAQEVTSTTLTADSQLTVEIEASTKYQFRFVLFFLNDGAAEGVKVSIGSSTGGYTPVNVLAQVYVNNVSLGRITALGGAGLGVAATGSSHVIIEGTIETGNQVGEFHLEFAQNATGASAGVHCQVGSSMAVSRLG